jgi:tellurium resistance protein TerD
MVSDELGQPFDPFAAEQKKEEEEARQKAEKAEKKAAEAKFSPEEREAAEKKMADTETARLADIESQMIPAFDLEKIDLKSTDTSGSKSVGKEEELSLELEGGAKLNKVLIGLGWDAPETTGEGDEFDLDASVFLLTPDGKVSDDTDFVFYNNLAAAGGAVRHHGDCKTGRDDDGDDEIITCQLDQIPFRSDKVVIVITIHEAYERLQHFGLVENAYVRLVDLDSNKELVRYNLTENADKKDAIIIGELTRSTTAWVFRPRGETFEGGLYQVARSFGVYVAPT